MLTEDSGNPDIDPEFAFILLILMASDDGRTSGSARGLRCPDRAGDRRAPRQPRPPRDTGRGNRDPISSDDFRPAQARAVAARKLEHS